MKLCSQCETGYHDQLTSCPIHGGLLSEIRELRPGMVIHKTYRIVRKLGQGGMGTVYLADHLLMEEPRALKFLSAELSQDAAFTGRFRREVRTLRQVRHKNVVDCGDLEQVEDDSLFFAMEFVNGPDLRTFLSKTPKPIDVEMVLGIVQGVAEGLGAAHAQGMVHRDIKPENILMARIGDTWVPKIADFGIVATKETSHFTQTGSSILTPFYAAPEQWRGARAADLDGRTDLYALGGVLFQTLTGEKVFEAENYEGWAYQHQRTPPRPPSSVRPELADWKGLDTLVVRLLAKEPAERPRDVSEVLTMLSTVQYVPTVSRRTVTLPAELPPKPETTAATPVAPKRVPAWAWAVAVVLLIAAAFAAGRIFGPQASKPAESPSSQPVPAVAQQAQSEATPTQPAGQPPVVVQPAKSAPQPAKSAKPGPEKVVPQPLPKPSVADAPKPSIAKVDPLAIKNQAEALYADKNYVESAGLFRQACDLGNEYSCNHLGFMYRGGEGVKQDYAQALALFSHACNAGSTGGCDNLGILYDKGWGVPEDPARAATFFTKGCDGGGGNACTNLGLLYLEGRGFERNPAKGRELLTKGCSLGDSRGCTRLQRLK